MRLTSLLPLLLLLLLSLPAPPVQGEVGYETHIKLNLYSPAVIKLDYEYTRNITIGDVSSLGPSLYEITHGPTGFRFSAADIDTYTFNLELVYAVRTRQVILLTIWSGSMPPNTVELPVEADRLLIHFEVNVQPEPRYPTADEITERLLSHLRGTLEEYHGENQRIFRLLNRTIAFYGYLAAINVVALLVLAAIIYTQLRRRGG